MKIRLQIFLILILNTLQITAQQTTRLTLPQVVEMARNQSISARQAATTKETKYWEYRTFQSNYKPQLTLISNVPAFNRTFQQVVQPDGTIVFQPVRNNNSSVGVFKSKYFKNGRLDLCPNTGATI
jgi:outer membrane protein